MGLKSTTPREPRCRSGVRTAASSYPARPQSLMAAVRGAADPVPIASETPTHYREGCVTFKDVAICFSREEWTLLSDSQKFLYHSVMLENFKLMASVGLIPPGTHEITQLQSWKEPVIPARGIMTPAMWTGYWNGAKAEQAALEQTALEQTLSTGKEMSTSLHQQQKLRSAEKPLKTEEGRIPVMKSTRNHLSETSLQSKCSGMYLQTSSHLGDWMTHGGDQPPRSTKSAEAIPTANRDYKCSDSDKTFSQNPVLVQHQRLYRREKKPFKCSECGKAFSRNAHLLRHYNVHTKVKRFKCSECGKAFWRNCSLVEHQTVHTGEKPYKCSECGKLFSKNCHLVHHQHAHFRSKPFKCNQCGRFFTWHSNLIRHERAHSEPKHYECRECGKVFRYSSGLSRHRKIHFDKYLMSVMKVESSSVV
ncbi:zinc finger protein 419 [Nannospalax galili]|uniref:zinc finger protein 419 n=1 Tax=Nannospalax galili TaxID=1026970 RepID=UPI0004ED4281|nr:zinc finger protein 419 [Nannospalax galili]